MLVRRCESSPNCRSFWTGARQQPDISCTLSHRQQANTRCRQTVAWGDLATSVPCGSVLRTFPWLLTCANNYLRNSPHAHGGQRARRWAPIAAAQIAQKGSSRSPQSTTTAVHYDTAVIVLADSELGVKERCEGFLDRALLEQPSVCKHLRKPTKTAGRCTLLLISFYLQAVPQTSKARGNIFF